MNKLPLFVSFYTQDEIYTNHANKLKKSLNKLQVEHRIVPLVFDRQVENSWVKVVSYKPSFIIKALSDFNRPICWVDADCYMLRIPHFMSNCNYDFAVAPRSGWNWSSGQLIFTPTEASFKLLRTWDEICKRYPLIWDQVSLSYAFFITQSSTSLKTFFISNDYFGKFNFRSQAIFRSIWNRKIAFAHFQASIESNKKIYDSDRGREFTAKNTPLWWREAMKNSRFFPLDERQKIELGMSEKYMM